MLVNNHSAFAKMCCNFPSGTYAFAFECFNYCRKIWTEKGRSQKVSSTKLCVIRSLVPSSTLGNELKLMLESESNVDIVDEKNSMLAITWLTNDSTIGDNNYLLSKAKGKD